MFDVVFEICKIVLLNKYLHILNNICSIIITYYVCFVQNFVRIHTKLSHKCQSAVCKPLYSEVF